MQRNKRKKKSSKKSWWLRFWIWLKASFKKEYGVMILKPRRHYKATGNHKNKAYNFNNFYLPDRTKVTLEIDLVRHKHLAQKFTKLQAEAATIHRQKLKKPNEIIKTIKL